MLFNVQNLESIIFPLAGCLKKGGGEMCLYIIRHRIYKCGSVISTVYSRNREICGLDAHYRFLSIIIRNGGL